MLRILRGRIGRPAAGAVLLLCTPFLHAIPLAPVRPSALTPADLVQPGAVSIQATAAPGAAYHDYFSSRLPSLFDLAPRARVSEPPPPGNVEAESAPIWTYRKGNWVLAAGASAAGTGVGLRSLLKEADDPAACCLMGTGLILMVLGPRRLKKRELARVRAMRVPRSA